MDDVAATIDPVLVANEHARAIGYVCIVWAAMEASADKLLSALLPLEDGKISDVVTTTVDLRDKLSIIKMVAFAKRGDDEWFRAVEWLVNRVDNELRPERNRYVHDAWLHQAGEVIRRTREAKLTKPQAFMRELVTFKDTPIMAQLIWALAEQIRNAEVSFTIRRLEYLGLVSEPAKSP